VFIIVFFLTFFFLASSYALAIPALVVGDIGALVPLTHTSYLEGYPVLFFTSQLSPEEITRLLQKKMTIIFADNDLVNFTFDLAFDLVEPKYRHKLPEEGKSRDFVAHVSDIYEIWGKGEGKLKILVDDKEIKGEDGQIEIRIGEWEIGNKGTRWRRLGSIELKEGRHSLSVNGQKDSFEELVIVPGTKLREYFTTVEDLLTNRKLDSAYLFTRRKSEGDRITRSFYVVREAHYKVKTKMSPNFEEAGQEKSVGLDLKIASPEEVENWSFDASNADYGYLATKPGMFVLSTYFDGDSKEDEWVAIRRKDIRVDLKRYPYFDLTYRVEDPKVQVVEARLGLDFTGDGTVDDHFTIGKSGGNSQLKDFNIYKALKKDFPDKEHYLLMDLKLYACKVKGVDCSRVEREGSYGYYFKEIQLYSKSALVVAPAWVSDFSKMKVSFTSKNVEWSYFVSGDGMLSVNPYFNGGVVSPVRKMEKEEDFVTVLVLENGEKLTGMLGKESTDYIELKNVVEVEGATIMVNKTQVSWRYRREAAQPKEEKVIEETEDEYVKVRIPVPGIDMDRYPFLRVIYRLQNSQVQHVDYELGIDLSNDGVVDKVIPVRRRLVLEDWKKTTPVNKTMDFYETRLPVEWPKTYNTKGRSSDQFTVHRDGIPVETTWSQWPDYQELVEVGGKEHNQLIISVPKGSSPEESGYTIRYLPQAEKSKIFPGFHSLEVNTKEMIKEVLGDKKGARLVSIFLYLKKGRGIDCSTSDREGVYTFDVKEVQVYRKSVPMIEEMLRADNKWVRKTPLFRIDDNFYSLEGIDKVTIDDSEDIWGEMEVNLPKGNHEFSGVPNKPFKVDMVLMEPASSQKPGADEGPKVNFRKVNPTRYVVDVKAREPFWLVFSESFHEGWKAYIKESPVVASQKPEYEGLSVETPRTRFEWSAVLSVLHDWRERKEVKEHYLVNGYANGWWIPVSGPSRFQIILEFTPQRLFEIGVVVSGITFILCISYLVYSYLKKRRKLRG